MSVDKLVNKALKRIGNVHPVVKQGAEEVIRRAYKQGIYVLFSDGYRSNAEQNALYAQGRTKPGSIVTNARGGQSLHNYGLALDMYITNKEGTSASWPASTIRRVAQIAKSIGFEWGGDWKSFKDTPHIQMTGGLSIAQLQAGKKPNISLNTGGTATVKPSKPQTKPITPTSKSLGLVDYMKSKNMDSSYSNRARLAKQYGISNYRGTASQNNKLLEKIKAGKPKQSKSSKKGNLSTNSIVTYLNSIGVNSSYANRSKLAAQHGIKGYKGTAKQNTTLLNKIRSGTSTASKPKGNQKTGSIVDYLKSIKVNSSFNNRAKLAKKHGIKNYKGTASQNAQLLKKIRG